MPSRASSSSAPRASPVANEYGSDAGLMESLRCQCGEMCTKLQGVGGMSWALLAVVTVYIALVNPSNTPAFFSNTWFKLVLFAFVIVVFVLEGPLVGTMFAIAMVLPIVYSSLREGYENPFIERYEGAGEDVTEESSTEENTTEENGTEKDSSVEVGSIEGHVEEDGVEESRHTEGTDVEESGVNDSGTESRTEHDGVAHNNPDGVESWCNYASVL